MVKRWARRFFRRKPRSRARCGRTGVLLKPTSDRRAVVLMWCGRPMADVRITMTINSRLCELGNLAVYNSPGRRNMTKCYCAGSAGSPLAEITRDRDIVNMGMAEMGPSVRCSGGGYRPGRRIRSPLWHAAAACARKRDRKAARHYQQIPRRRGATLFRYRTNRNRLPASRFGVMPWLDVIRKMKMASRCKTINIAVTPRDITIAIAQPPLFLILYGFFNVWRRGVLCAHTLYSPPGSVD